MALIFVIRRNKMFDLLVPRETGMLVGNNEMVNIKYCGNVRANLESNSVILEFINVLLNKNLPINLVSVIKLLEMGWEVKSVNMKNFVLCKSNFELIGSYIK